MIELLRHALIEYYAFAACVIWPAVRLCQRAGLPTGYAATLGVPWLGLLIYSCMLAFTRWPANIRPAAATPAVAMAAITEEGTV